MIELNQNTNHKGGEYILSQNLVLRTHGEFTVE